MLADAIGWIGEWSSSASGSKEVSIISSPVTKESSSRSLGLLELVAERGRRFLLVEGTGNGADTVEDVIRSIVSEFLRFGVIVEDVACQG